MKGFFITIVDVLGILIPGLLLITGLCLIPPVGNILPILKELLGQQTETISTLTAGSVVLVLSYIAGFMLRLSSVRLMQEITLRKCLFIKSWPALLEVRMRPLLTVMTDAIGDPQLCNALEEVSKTVGPRDPAHYTPHVQYAKRIAKAHSPVLRTEVERIEAEMRFLCGLLVPLLLWAVVGMAFIHGYLAVVVTAASLAGALLVSVAFPSRRVREVEYNYYLAIIALKLERAPTKGNRIEEY